MQTQQQIAKNKQKQAQFEIYHNESYRMTFAEIERLFRFLGKDVGHEFRENLMSADQNVLMVMMNIEGFLQALGGYKIIGKRDKLEQYCPPTNCDDLYKKWSNALQDLDPKDQESKVAKELLTFLVEKLSKGEPLEELSADLSEKIMSQKQRDAYCEEMGKSETGQRKMMNIVNTAHNLADNIHAQVEKLADNPRNLKFSRRKAIDVQTEDIQYADSEEGVQTAIKDTFVDNKNTKKDGEPSKVNESKSCFSRICQFFRLIPPKKT